MSRSPVTAAAAAAVFCLSGLGATAQAPIPSHATSAAKAGAGGIHWTVPPRWTAGAGSSMRVATYAVPAATAAAAAECAVFFFGSGQGGGVDENVARWGKQFEGAPAPKRSASTVAGMRVTRAEVAGTYLAPGGPMMQSTGKKTGYRLLGAIVEAPEGNVFFKLTGPAATVAAAQADFEALVASIRKG
jgi:hypothetical protein